MKNIYKFLLDYIRELGVTEFLAKPGAAFICILIIVFVAWFAHFLTRQIILRFVSRIAKHTKTDWDDILIRKNVFSGLAHIVPALILYYTAGFSYPVLHQDLSELGTNVVELLSKDYYFTLTGFLINISRFYLTLIIVF